MIQAVIAGLGNPGKEYERTRHNVGFRIVDQISELWGGDRFRLIESVLVKRVPRVDTSDEVVLLRPQLYMNRSGHALARIFPQFDCSSEKLIVVHDDVDLEFGRIQIKKSGGSGGHKGVQSIIEQLQTPDFVRIRIGIGRPPDELEVTEYVLQPFTAAEEKALEAVMKRVTLSVEVLLQKGLVTAMNEFNQSPTE